MGRPQCPYPPKRRLDGNDEARRTGAVPRASRIDGGIRTPGTPSSTPHYHCGALNQLGHVTSEAYAFTVDRALHGGFKTMAASEAGSVVVTSADMASELAISARIMPRLPAGLVWS